MAAHQVMATRANLDAVAARCNVYGVDSVDFHRGDLCGSKVFDFVTASD